MAKKKRVVRRKHNRVQPVKFGFSSGRSLKRTFSTCIFFLFFTVIFYVLSLVNFQSNAATITFVLLTLLAGVVSAAFFFVWLILLIMSWMKK